MTAIEKKFVLWIERRSLVLFLTVVCALGIAARLTGFSFVSPDASFFLLPWFDQIVANGGLSALSEQVGNYNIPYQLLIGLLSYLPFEPLYMYKALSCVFDFALAAGCVFLLRSLRPAASKLLCALLFSAVLFVPGVVMNSSLWAQCDSIYATFLLFSLAFLFKKRNIPAFVLLATALSFKLQAVFILPFFLCFYFSCKSYSLLHFLALPATGYALCLPAFFLGRSLAAPIGIYLSQTNTYRYMYLKFPSLWVLIGDDYESLSALAVLSAVAALGAGLIYVIIKKPDLSCADGFVSAACWSLWTCLLLLPAMHERYSYVLDVLLIVCAALNKKRLPFAVLACLISAATYGVYLFDTPVNLPLMSAAYLAAYIAFSLLCLKDFKPAAPHNAGVPA